MPYRLHLLTILFVVSWLIGCTQPKPATLEVTNAWIRPVDASLGIAGALYLTISNNTLAPITLLGAKTAIANPVELHQSTMTNNIMRMRPVDAFHIASGAQLSFAPGGNHLMLKNLSSSLLPGDSLAFTLQFDQHAPVKAYALVQWEKP
ncbi:MAG: copper chaperone PCu(A)C [Bacteroidota bacterium]